MSIRFSGGLLLIILFFSTATYSQSPAPIKLVDVIISPNHADWNYKVNENALVEVMVLQYGVPVKNASVSFEIGPELLPADNKGKLELSNGRGKIDVGSSKEPGFRRVVVKAIVNGNIYGSEAKLAFS